MRVALPALLTGIISIASADLTVLEAPSLTPDLGSDLFPTRVGMSQRVTLQTTDSITSLQVSRDQCATTELDLPLSSVSTGVLATTAFSIASPGVYSLCIPTNALLIPSVTIAGVVPQQFTRQVWKRESFSFTGYGLRSGDRMKFVAPGADCLTAPVSLICTDQTPICALSLSSTKSSFELSTPGWAGVAQSAQLQSFSSYQDETSGEYRGVLRFASDSGLQVGDVVSLYGVGCVPFYSCTHADALALMGRGSLRPTVIYLPFEESPFTTARTRMNFGMSGEWQVEGGNGYSVSNGKKASAGNFGSDTLRVESTVDAFNVNADWTLCVYANPLVESGVLFEHVGSGVNVNITMSGFVNLNVPGVALNTTEHIMFIYPNTFTLVCAVHQVQSASAGLLRIYLDNNLYVDSATVLSAVRLYETQAFTFGPGFVLDELRIYDYALTLDELVFIVDDILSPEFTYPLEYLTSEVTVAAVADAGSTVEVGTARGGSWDRFIVHTDLFKYEVHSREESLVEIVAAQAANVDICWAPQGSADFLLKAGTVQFQSYSTMPFTQLHVLNPVIERDSPFVLTFKLSQETDQLSLIFANPSFLVLDTLGEQPESIFSTEGADCGRVITEFWASASLTTTLPALRRCSYAIEGATWIVQLHFDQDSGLLQPGHHYQLAFWARATSVLDVAKPVMYVFGRKNDVVTEVSAVFASRSFTAATTRRVQSAVIVKSFDEDVAAIDGGLQLGADVTALNFRLQLEPGFSGEFVTRLIFVPVTTWRFKYSAKCSVGCESASSTQCQGLSCQYERAMDVTGVFNSVKLRLRISDESGPELLVSVRGLFADTFAGFFPAAVGVSVRDQDFVWSQGYTLLKRPSSPGWIAKLGVSGASNLHEFKGEQNELLVLLKLPETMQAGDQLELQLPVGYVCDAVLTSELWTNGWTATGNTCVYTAPEGSVWFKNVLLNVWVQVHNPDTPMSETNFNNRWYVTLRRPDADLAFKQSFFSAQSASAVFKPRVGVLGEVGLVAIVPVDNILVGEVMTIRVVFTVEQAGAVTLTVRAPAGFDLTSHCHGEAVEGYAPPVLSCAVLELPTAVSLSFGDSFDAWLDAELAVDVQAVALASVYGVSKALNDLKSWELVTYAGALALDRSRDTSHLSDWTLISSRSAWKPQVLTVSKLPGTTTATVKFSMPSVTGILKVEAAPCIEFASVDTYGNLGVSSSTLSIGLLTLPSITFSDSVEYEFQVTLKLPTATCAPLPNAWKFVVDSLVGDLVLDAFKLAVVAIQSVTPELRVVSASHFVKLEFLVFAASRTSQSSTDELQVLVPSGFTLLGTCRLNGVGKSCTSGGRVSIGGVLGLDRRHSLEVQVKNPSAEQSGGPWTLTRLEKVGNTEYVLDAAGTVASGFSVTSQFSQSGLVDISSLVGSSDTAAQRDALYAEVQRDDRPDAANRVLVEFVLEEELDLANAQIDEYTSRPFAYRIRVEAASGFEFSGDCGSTVDVLSSEIFTPQLRLRLGGASGSVQALPGEVMSCLVPVGQRNILTITFGAPIGGGQFVKNVKYFFAVRFQNPNYRSDDDWEFFLTTANNARTFSSGSVTGLSLNQAADVKARLLHRQLAREAALPLLNAVAFSATTATAVEVGGAVEVAVSEGYLLNGSNDCPVIDTTLSLASCRMLLDETGVSLILAEELPAGSPVSLTLTAVVQELPRGETSIPSTVWTVDTSTSAGRGLDRGSATVEPLSLAIESLTVWSNFTDALGLKFHGFDVVSDLRVSVTLRDEFLPGERLEITWPANWPACDDVAWITHSFSSLTSMSVTCEDRGDSLRPVAASVFVAELMSGSIGAKEAIVLDFPATLLPGKSLADALNYWSVAHIRGEVVVTAGAVPAWSMVPQISDVEIKVVSSGVVVTLAAATVQISFTGLHDANYVFVTCSLPTTTNFRNARSPDAQLVRTSADGNAVELRADIMAGVAHTLTLTDVVLGHVGGVTQWTLRTAVETFTADGGFLVAVLDEGLNIPGFSVAQAVSDIRVRLLPGTSADEAVTRGNKAKLELDVLFPLVVNMASDWVRVRFLQPFTTHTFAVVGNPESAQFQEDGRAVFARISDVIVADGAPGGRIVLNRLAVFTNTTVQPVDPAVYAQNTRVLVEVFRSEDAVVPTQSSNGTTRTSNGALFEISGFSFVIRFPPNAVNEVRMEIPSGLIHGSSVEAIRVAFPSADGSFFTVPSTGCLSSLAEGYTPASATNGRGILKATACTRISESVLELTGFRVTQVKLANFVPLLTMTSELYGIFAFKIRSPDIGPAEPGSFSVTALRGGIAQAWGSVLMPEIAPLDDVVVKFARVPNVAEVLELQLRLPETLEAGSRLRLTWAPVKTLQMRCEFTDFFQSSYDTLFAAGKQTKSGPVRHAVDPEIGEIRDCACNDELGELSFSFVEKQTKGLKRLGWLMRSGESSEAVRLSVVLLNTANLTIGSIYQVQGPRVQYGVAWKVPGPEWTASPQWRSDSLVVNGKIYVDWSRYKPQTARVFKALRLRLDETQILKLKSADVTGMTVKKWEIEGESVKGVIGSTNKTAEVHAVRIAVQVDTAEIDLVRFYIDLCETTSCEDASRRLSFLFATEPEPVTQETWAAFNATTATTPPPVFADSGAVEATAKLVGCLLATMLLVLIN